MSKSYQNNLYDVESVRINISHNYLKMRLSEIQIDLNWSVLRLKQFIESKVGTCASSMSLCLQDNNLNPVCSLNEDDRPLSFFPFQDHYNIHVIDLDPNSVLKGFDDLDSVEKYIMSEKDYDALPDNFRKFKKQFLINNPQFLPQNIIKAKDDLNIVQQSISVGDRCQLVDKKYRGIVKYVGIVQQLDNQVYIGIQLDEPHGKNNGSVKGHQYFLCDDNYGIFLKPDKIQVGDFPELDPFGSEEDEI